MRIKAIHPAIFLVSASTLIFQITVTRILSVTLLYHYAFVVISLSMLGLTGGALISYRFRTILAEFDIRSQLSFSSLFFGLFIPLSIIAHNGLFQIFGVDGTVPLVLFTCVFIAIPLLFSGFFVCTALTKVEEGTEGVYAADLIGGAVGCLAIVGLLSVVSIVTLLLLASLSAITAAYIVSTESTSKMSKIGLAGILSLMVVETVLEQNNGSLMVFRNSFEYVWTGPPLFDKWNSYSRITVRPIERTAFGWGLSKKFTYPDIDQMMMMIDSCAGTPLARFDGDFSKVEFIKHDIINSVYNLRANADVFIAGIGGGRDILSALVFQQHEITAVEINTNVAGALKTTFSEFIGHIAERPNVHLYNDDARSYLHQTDKKFDIIQISLVDTVAASAGGALVLTENSLYTTEAWRLYISRLTPGGILSVSRWYGHAPGDHVEGTRLLVLAEEALKQSGISDPQSHLLLLRNYTSTRYRDDPVLTLLLSPTPWSAEDVSKIDAYADQNGFGVILQPDKIGEDWVGEVIKTPDIPKLEDEHNARLFAPTDDLPFYFETSRFDELLKLSTWTNYQLSSLGILKLIVILLVLSLGVGVFCVVSVGTPNEAVDKIERNLMAIYFLSIGCGFMLIEISFVQRFIVFLGHPALSLSVILASLLLSSGVGSYLSGRISRSSFRTSATLYTVSLCLLVFALIFAVPFIIDSFHDQIRFIRILIVFAVVSLSGIFMGTFFPMGMRFVGKESQLAPWFWSLNGAASIFASILQMFIALGLGIMIAFAVGVFFYFMATAALLTAIYLRTKSNRVLV